MIYATVLEQIGPRDETGAPVHALASSVPGSLCQGPGIGFATNAHLQSKRHAWRTRHCGVPYVRLIPQDLQALNLELFAHASQFRLLTHASSLDACVRSPIFRVGGVLKLLLPSCPALGLPVQMDPIGSYPFYQARDQFWRKADKYWKLQTRIGGSPWNRITHQLPYP